MLIIESDNYAAAGIETMFFPGGEPHAKCTEALKGDVLLVLKMRTWNDVGLGACVKDMLSRNPRVEKLYVFIPYFPGARQDRSDGLAPYTLGIMSQLLNVLGSVDISTFDLHSATGVVELLPRYNFGLHHLQMKPRPGIVGIIAPDKGAMDRAWKFRDKFYHDAELLQCEKTRDPATGRLYGYKMPRLPYPGGYIIVDDICDGGGTFNLLAEAFGKDPLGNSSFLELFVSHGIFSKGLVNIDPRIARITTTDSWCRESYMFGYDADPKGRLEIIKLDQLYPIITGGTGGA